MQSGAAAASDPLGSETVADLQWAGFQKGDGRGRWGVSQRGRGRGRPLKDGMIAPIIVIVCPGGAGSFCPGYAAWPFLGGGGQV